MNTIIAINKMNEWRKWINEQTEWMENEWVKEMNEGNGKSCCCWKIFLKDAAATSL